MGLVNWDGVGACHGRVKIVCQISIAVPEVCAQRSLQVSRDKMDIMGRIDNGIKSQYFVLYQH